MVVPTATTPRCRSSFRASARISPAMTTPESAIPESSWLGTTIATTTNAPATIPNARSIRSSGNAIAKYSVTPTSAALPTSHANSDQGFQTMIQTSNGIAIAAVASLVRNTQAFALGLLAGAAETALPALELGDRLEELPLAEVRPERVRHVDLGVGDLPQEEVTDPHLTARADQEIGIWNAGSAERRRNQLLIDGLGSEIAALDAAGDRAHGFRQLLTAAVADGEDDRHAGVPLGALDDVAERELHLAGELPDVADREEADAILHHPLHFGHEVVAEKAHQRRHFVLWAVPVLAREGVEAQVRDAEPARGLDDLLHRVLATAMPHDTGQPALGSPTPVSVHDDRDVARQALFVDRDHQTAMISSSLDLRILSTFSTYSLVRCSTRSCCFFRSSSVRSFSLWSSFSMPIASWRCWRTDTRNSSAVFFTCFTRSLRRCSVSSGIGMRMILPSFTGVRPRSDWKIARSISPIALRSNGWMTSKRDSGAVIDES